MNVVQQFQNELNALSSSGQALIAAYLSLLPKDQATLFYNGVNHYVAKLTPPPLTPPFGGQERHITPGGSIVSAINSSSPGDTITIHAGVYEGDIEISKSGAVGHEIVIRGAPNEPMPTIRRSDAGIASNNTLAPIVLNGAKNVWISGLKILGSKGRAGAPTEEHFSANGVTLQGGAGIGVRLHNLDVSNAHHCGIKEQQHGGQAWSVEYCQTYDNGSGVNKGLDHGIYAPSDDVKIIGTIAAYNKGAGFHFYPLPARAQVRFCLAIDNDSWGAIQGGADGIFEHNTFTRNKWGFGLFRGGCLRNILRNSILWGNTNTDTHVDSGSGSPSQNVSDHCLFAVTPPSAFGATGSVIGNPQFASDFRLLPTSPAINKGVIGSFSYLGSAPDLGAYEFA